MVGLKRQELVSVIGPVVLEVLLDHGDLFFLEAAVVVVLLHQAEEPAQVVCVLVLRCHHLVVVHHFQEVASDIRKGRHSRDENDAGQDSFVVVLGVVVTETDSAQSSEGVVDNSHAVGEVAIIIQVIGFDEVFVVWIPEELLVVVLDLCDDEPEDAQDVAAPHDGRSQDEHLEDVIDFDHSEDLVIIISLFKLSLRADVFDYLFEPLVVDLLDKFGERAWLDKLRGLSNTKQLEKEQQPRVVIFMFSCRIGNLDVVIEGKDGEQVEDELASDVPFDDHGDVPDGLEVLLVDVLVEEDQDDVD